jgi:putative transposase
VSRTAQRWFVSFTVEVERAVPERHPRPGSAVGGRVVLAGRWFPSSKTCSACGTVKATLSLAERTFRCGRCGLVTDRDVNAANLLTFAASGAENQNACGGTVRPRLARHVPVKQEPGTAHAGKTGTAGRQRTAAA